MIGIINTNFGNINAIKNIYFDEGIDCKSVSNRSEIDNVSKLRLFDKNKLQNNIKYLARIRLYLDIDSLPSPLRPRAYFSSDWNISSQWYRWEI